LFYVVLSVGLWSTATYAVQQQVVKALLKPAHNQQFIYTSVGGGVDFLFRVCLYVGIALSIPVIFYQILKYIEPLIKKDAVKFITWASAASGILALGGMAFGYFIGLPAALHFLLHQFTTSQIHPLLTIQSYMSFVIIYMVGSALLFQLPLIIITTNRIKPLKPRSLFKYERWVILLAFIGGGLMNPSPRLQDQLLLSGPVILTYQLGILIVWLMNRGHKRPSHIIELMEKDAAMRAERLAKFRQAQTVAQQVAVAKIAPRTAAVTTAHQAATPPRAPMVHPQPIKPAAPIIAPQKQVTAPPVKLHPQAVAPKPAALHPTGTARPVVRQTRYLNDIVGRRQPYTQLREDIA